MPNDSEIQTTDKKSKETCTDVHQDPENLPVPSADSTDQIEETITTHSASNTKADQPDNHENEKRDHKRDHPKPLPDLVYDEVVAAYRFTIRHLRLLMVDINHRCQNIGSAEQVEEALALWRDMGMLDFDKHTV